MKLKKILKLFKFNRVKEIKLESDDSYCYSNIIWNSEKRLIILLSFTEDYFEQVIEIQDAINNTDDLHSKIVFSSYDEETDKKDEDGDTIVIIHKKHYMLIGGHIIGWKRLYQNIHNLSNNVLSAITNEITNNCSPYHFEALIEDGVLNEFKRNEESKYDELKITKNNNKYIDPEVLISRLPKAFTGRDILRFVEIDSHGVLIKYPDALTNINHICNMPESLFKTHELYPLYAAVVKNPTPSKLGMLLKPLYMQTDDDTIPGDVSDESLDEIFREHHERFSAVADDNVQYEDIDEVLEDDEESENIKEEDKI